MMSGPNCFGRLRLAGFELSAESGPRRMSEIPFELSSELRHHAATAVGLREMADFLGICGRAPESEVIERVVRELEWGHLVCKPRRPAGLASSLTIPEPEATDLCELAVLETTPVEYVVELQLIDQDELPIGGVSYRLTLPDGSVREGTLDQQGTARVPGLTSSEPCEVCFPTLDAESWSYVHATPL